jgi:WD40 repeat protein
VAIKLIKAGMDSRQVIARFEAERQALALMDHANIARVLEAGTTGTGRPYFVMDLVKGVAITKYCDEHRLTPRQRLDLFVPVCQAVQHAHQKGVIHRDLKPSNVLVALYDGRPVPKVIDFGVAKAAGQSLTDKTLVTGFGNIVGTLEYMSPEQAEVNQLDIDTRSDIYSLGVLLYELLAGSPPFTRKDLEKAGMLEMLRVIREQEPSKPSTRLSTAEGLPTLAANRGTEPAKLTKLVRRELDWIVMKALEKDRRRRYETASAFAADVQHYLDDEPVAACPPSAAYRLRKFARRHRVALVTSALVAAALVLGTAVSVWQAVRATRAEGTAREQRDAARAAQNDEAQARRRAEDLAEQSRRRQVRLNVEQGTRLMNDGDLAGSLPYFVEVLRLDSEDPKRTEDHRLRLGMLLAQCPKPAKIWFHDQPVSDVCFRRDGRAVAVALNDGTVTVRDVDSGQPIGPILKHADRIDCLDFSPDGRRMIAACLDRTARIWDIATGREVVPPMVHPGEVRWVSFSPDGRLVVTAARGRNAGDPIQNDFLCRVWDAATGRPVLDRFLSHFRHRVIFSPDSRSIVLCNPSNTLRVLDARTGRPNAPPLPLSREIFGDTFGERSFSRDGRRIAVDCLDRVSRVWDMTTGAVIASPPKFSDLNTHSSFSPDGRWVLTACNDGTARVWNADTGALRFDPMRHPAMVHNAVFSPDGTLVGTACGDHAVRVWNASTGQLMLPPLWHQGRPLEEFQLDFSPDGRSLLTASMDHTVRLWDLAGAGLAGQRLLHSGGVNHIEFNRDGHSLVTTGSGEARVWDAATGAPLGVPMIHRRGEIAAARISPDGRSLLTMGWDRFSSAPFDAWMWDLETRTVKAGPLRHPNEEESGWIGGVTALVAWSPDGRRLATAAGSDQYRDPVPCTVRVWDAQTGAPVTPFLRYDVPVFALEFSPDGRSLVTASGALRQWGPPGEVRVLDASTGSPRIPPIRTPSVCRSVHFSPDGRRLVTACGVIFWGEGEARVWDAATGQPLTPPMSHAAAVLTAAFSPDGRLVLTASDDATARIWDAATGVPIMPPLMHRDPLGSARFSPDGRWVLTHSGSSQVWDVATGRPVTPALWPGQLTGGAQFSPDGRRLVATLNDGGALVCELKPDERTLDDLIQMAKVLSGTRVDASGAAVPLAMSELQEAYEALLRKAPKTFNATPEQVLGWHHRQAGLHKLQSIVNNNLVWPLATSPDPRLRDPSRAVELAKQAVELAPQEGGHWNTLGIAQYRAGDWKAAITALEKSMELLSGQQESFNTFFLAMAHWQLGDKDEARRWYDQAVEWTDKHQPKNEDLRRFRAEAAELMGLNEKK